MRSKRTRLVIAGAAGLAAVVVATLLITAGPATAKQFATLDIMSGDVDVRPAGEPAFEDGVDGQTLRVGDRVRTGFDGRAEIEYFDGSATRLDYRTSFVLRELASVDGGTGKVIAAEQSGGATFHRVVELTGSESRYDVATPTAIASVRGTGFVVRHLADGATTLWVVDGAVLSAAADGSRDMVMAGQGINIDADGDAGKPFRLTGLQLTDPFMLFNLCDLDVSNACFETEVLPVTITAPTPPKAEEPKAEPVQVQVGQAEAEPSAAPAPDQKKDGPKKKGDGGDGGGRKDAPPPASAPPPTQGSTGPAQPGGGPPDEDPEPDPDPIGQVVSEVCDLVTSNTGIDPEPPC